MTAVVEADMPDDVLEVSDMGASVDCGSIAVSLALDATLDITELSVERSSTVGRSLPVI